MGQQIADIVCQLWNDSRVDVDAVLSPHGLTRPTASGTALLDNIAPRIARILADLHAEKTDNLNDIRNLCKAIVYSYRAHIAAANAQDILDAFVSAKGHSPENKGLVSDDMKHAIYFFVASITLGLAVAFIVSGNLGLIIAAGSLCVGLAPFTYVATIEAIRRGHERRANHCLQVAQRYKSRVWLALHGLSSHARDKFPHRLLADMREKFGADETPSVATIIDFALDDDNDDIESIQIKWSRLYRCDTHP